MQHLKINDLVYKIRGNVVNINPVLKKHIIEKISGWKLVSSNKGLNINSDHSQRGFRKYALSNGTSRPSSSCNPYFSRSISTYSTFGIIQCEEIMLTGRAIFFER